MKNVFDISATLLEAINKVLLKEHELTRREVKAVDQKYAGEIAAHRNVANAISGHVFGENDRIVIPLSVTPHPTKTTVETHLLKNGFSNTDYLGGLTTDKYGRSVSIGKALTRTGAEKDLIDKYAGHQKTYASEKELEDRANNLQVVISKHPHDVIGMSQGTEWGIREHETYIGKSKPVQSCMAFDTAKHTQHMPHELAAGTHIAWLTPKGDNEAKEPISRITLRPYTSYGSETHSAPTPTGYSFEIPTTSEYYKNIARNNTHNDSADVAIKKHISSYGSEYRADKFLSVNVSKHPTDDRYIANVKFSRPLSLKDAKRFHDWHIEGEESGLGAWNPEFENQHTMLVPSANVEDQKFTGYKFDIPTTSNLHKQVMSGKSKDETPEAALTNKVLSSIKNSSEDYLDLYKSSIGVSVQKHPTEEKYVCTINLNKGLKPKTIRYVHGDVKHVLNHPENEHSLHEFIEGYSNTPSTTNRSTILVPGSKTYGEQSSAFRDTVKAWTNQHFSPKSNETYHAAHGIYLDGDEQTIKT